MGFPTPLTKLLGIEVPIMSAGMAGVAGPELVAAVSNAGGIGTLGAIGMPPVALRDAIQQTRALLVPRADGESVPTHHVITALPYFPPRDNSAPLFAKTNRAPHLKSRLRPHTQKALGPKHVSNPGVNIN